MDAGATRDKASPPPKPSKFSVYQNPSFSAVLTANSLQPSSHTFLSIVSFFSASSLAFIAVLFREDGLIDFLRLKNISQETAYWLTKTLQTFVGLIFAGTVFALLKAIFLRKVRYAAAVPAMPASKVSKNEMFLTNNQLGLLGVKPKAECVQYESIKKHPKSKSPSISSDLLVPLHQLIPSPRRSPNIDNDGSNSNRGGKGRPISTPSKSPLSSLYVVPGVASPPPSLQNSGGIDSVISGPWSNRRAASASKITSEEKLEQFLAEVSEKINESAGKLFTPPPTMSGFGIASPNTATGSAKTSGTTRLTPLRPVRMSAASQKFSTPPKKGESDLPSPMSMEESIEAFEHLGIYPQIELWRDHLRQWFSSVLLNPLLTKIENSHIQVMQAASKLGISITINQVGNDMPSLGTPATFSAIDKTKDWQPQLALNEDGHLHQLRSTLVQAIEGSTSKLPLSNLQQGPQAQQNTLVPIMQDCLDAITEHQKLQALVKGEWVKGLLPQSTVRADYTVQRILELAEGTCLKNYEYFGSGEVYDTKSKKWTAELPSDSHLLLYLFCAFLEHPKWMLHVDATSHAGVQSSKNPLFLGVLPPKERFPEKYIAVVATVPSVLHPGACILVVGKQSPPIFALYWDKKLQFSLQGRAALWDSILLLCQKIRVGYGGIVRGMHLGSSALSILPVLETETDFYKPNHSVC